MRRSFSFRPLLLVLLLAPPALSRVAGGDPAKLGASVSPVSGRPGDQVAFLCSGLAASEVRYIEFTGDAASVVSMGVTSQGLRIETHVPGAAKTGPVWIIARLSKIDAGIFTITSQTVAAVGSDSDATGGNLAGGNLAGQGRSSGPISASPSALPAYDPDADLPVEAPVLGSKKPDTPPLPPVAPPVEPPPPTIYGKDLKSESGTVIYVIDISGSMGWDMGQYTGVDGQIATGCRLDRAKAELSRSVMSLPKSFKFNLESYDCSTYVCFSDSSDGYMPLVRADDSNKATACAWILALKPQGATGTGPAVVNALFRRENKLIVLLTDGAPNCGAGSGDGNDPACLEAHLSQIHWGNEQRATINVFGIGATGDFKQFCLNVASQNGGSYTDVR